MPQTEWFKIECIAPGITSIAEPLHTENVKSYLVEGEQQVAVIDTGLGVGDFAGVVRKISQKQPIVLLTHAHWDHIGAVAEFPEVLVHPSEAYAVRRGFPNAMMRMLFGPDAVRSHALPATFNIETAAIKGCEPTGELHEGDRIDLGGRVLEVFHTPGHSQGGVSFLDSESGILFTGDALNYGELWLYLPRSDAAAYRQTLHTLARIVEERDVRVLYPSHFTVPMYPADVCVALECYEQVWSGQVAPTRHADFDIGFPEKVPSDIFEFEKFTFLMGTGRYGDAALTTGSKGNR